MLKAILDAVMERRARQLMEQVGEWLPTEGPLLDLGSGTGHLAARLERVLGLEVVTADVSDIHVAGRPPVLIADGLLPFEEETFSAALLCFMLAYPNDPAGLLGEVVRVTRGPIILVQSLHANRLGYAWLRVRELFWTIVAFHVSKFLATSPRRRSSPCIPGASIPNRGCGGTWWRPGCGSGRGGSGPCYPAAPLLSPRGAWGAMTERRLSFVIPARNEEALIGEVVEAILASVARASGVSRNDLWLPDTPFEVVVAGRRERGRYRGHRGDLRR
jgi:SAM-dependent methyltransferase